MNEKEADLRARQLAAGYVADSCEQLLKLAERHSLDHIHYLLSMTAMAGKIEANQMSRVANARANSRAR
ncbi:hypothetical protein [Terrihabitans rhizophilus]|uniref:Uncharacterized protein n=1 Tax=Terrihabitans rhizophilus TaxID=3092662 RepID=A0ABU4RUX1_9HYPH|nr:hypothetical protein [Terrihabitans sp. PJ23]MDX6807420.1 hypothetical protein [Terrihabitans sp. PJ23]